MRQPLAILLLGLVTGPWLVTGRSLKQDTPELLGLNRGTKSVRVMTFGDSITEGWIQTRWVKTPWDPWVRCKAK
jgi:hypothetical protein